MSHRFNVNFSEGAYRDLSTLAKRKDTTMSERPARCDRAGALV